MKYYMWEK